MAWLNYRNPPSDLTTDGSVDWKALKEWIRLFDSIEPSGSGQTPENQHFIQPKNVASEVSSISRGRCPVFRFYLPRWSLTFWFPVIESCFAESFCGQLRMSTVCGGPKLITSFKADCFGIIFCDVFAHIFTKKLILVTRSNFENVTKRTINPVYNNIEQLHQTHVILVCWCIGSCHIQIFTCKSPKNIQNVVRFG